MHDRMIDTDLTSPGIERIVPPGSELEVVADGLMFGEGPVWKDSLRTLYWVDILDSTIWSWTNNGGRQVVMRPSGRANGMTLDSEDRLVVAGWSSRNIWRMDGDGSVSVLAESYRGQLLNSPNDIVVRSDGAIYWTDPSGALFIPGMEGEDVQRYLDFHGVMRLPAGGREVELVTDDCSYPNGLAFSPDERVLFVADTWGRCVRRYELREGETASAGEVFYELVGTEDGVADGMKVDTDGNVYVTGPGGIHVLSPSGRLLGRILFPEDHVTNMAWGERDWQSLFVTTFRRVYRLRLGIPGIPVGSAMTR